MIFLIIKNMFCSVLQAYWDTVDARYLDFGYLE